MTIKNVSFKVVGKVHFLCASTTDGIYEELPLVDGFTVHEGNEFLRSLNTGIDVHFETWKQYENLINQISEAIK